MPAGWGGNWSGDNSTKYCVGLWPNTGQSGYGNPSCYGADEPGIDFYSAMPGSGGNVSWNLTLPVDRSPTLNQSDLYDAIWLGMTLTDPNAWMDACYLELQFYPDSSWYAPSPHNPAGSVYGLWVGEAVAWQIDVATGAEDPCFISPLFTNGVLGPSFLNMSQGDHVVVQMTGWTNDPYGENITIDDLTSGASSFVNLYNRTGEYANEYNAGNRYISGVPNYPLDPSYVADDVENSLAWTPGGEFPTTFAFEVGHGANPTIPETNPVGGCSPGVPPGNPSTPCPSYDPGSWLNDTQTPWQIGLPTFSNGTSTSLPAQVAFSQDLGALGWVDNATGTAVTTACIGRASTSWCSYPWYSYSCSEAAFNFGATDWVGTSADFGADNEWPSELQTDSAGLSFYAPENFSIPACGHSSYTVTIGASGDGTAYFLSRGYGSATAVADIGAGNYSLNAEPAYGEYFTGWTTTGSVSVTNPNATWANLVVNGTGTVTAGFASTSPSTTVVSVASAGGGVEFTPGLLESNRSGFEIGAGASRGIAPGLYSILAVPGSGENFTKWTMNNSALEILSPTLPYTWIVVPVGAGPVRLTAGEKSTTLQALIIVEDYIGDGTVNFDGQGATGAAEYSEALGGYSIVAAPNTGWAFAGWVYGGPGATLVLSNLADPTTAVVLEALVPGGTDVVGAEFAPSVTFDDVLNGSGAVAIASLGYGPATNGTSFLLSPGGYTIAGAPSSGYEFTDWSVSNPAALWVPSPLDAVTELLVNTSGTVTANFASAPSVDQLWLNDTPSDGGTVLFNYVSYPSGAEDLDAAPGLYAAFPVPDPGYTFLGWTATGDVAVLQTNLINITSAPGVGGLSAAFSPDDSPVSFTGYGSATLGGTTLTSGGGTSLVTGSYSLSVVVPPNATFVRWATQGSISVASPSNANTTLDVTGPGTVTALETAPPLKVGPINASATRVPIDEAVVLNATVVSGPGPYTYVWSGCGRAVRAPASYTCIPNELVNYTIDVNVTDSFGDSQLASPVVIQVVPAFTATLHATPPAVTLGAPIAITSFVAAGTAPYSYSFGGLPPGCAVPTSGNFTCVPTAAGPYTLTLTVTDARGLHASTSLDLVVNPPITLAGPVASPANLSLGTSTTLSTVVEGGTFPLELRYSGLPSGCVSANSSTLTCSPTATGPYTVTLVATDAGGGNATARVTLQVNAVLMILEFSAIPSNATVGTPAIFGVSLAGGTAPFTYSYSGLPPDCPTADEADLTCTSQVVGTYSVRIVVTDADGVAASAVTPFSVTTAPAPPTGSGTVGLSTTGWIVVGAAVVAAAVVAVVLITRRPPRRPSGAPSPANASDGGEGPGAPPAPDQEQIYGR